MTDKLNLIFEGIKLCPFNRNFDHIGEEQQPLQWRIRQIIDTEHTLRSFFYVELESIELKQLDKPNARPLYSARICQLEFQIKTKVN